VGFTEVYPPYTSALEKLLEHVSVTLQMEYANKAGVISQMLL
jgi:hypothetical protein